jgi:hypothetical protein
LSVLTEALQESGLISVIFCECRCFLSQSYGIPGYAPCNLTDGDSGFSESLIPTTKVHEVTSRKITILILTFVRITNVAFIVLAHRNLDRNLNSYNLTECRAFVSGIWNMAVLKLNRVPVISREIIGM